MLANKDLLLFDFDGTIADSSPLHEQAFKQVLEPLGVAVDYPRIAGRATRDAVRMCFEMSSKPLPSEGELETLLRRKQELGRELIASSLGPLPAADALLHWVRGRHRLALVTSGSRATIDLSLQRLGYTDWFEILITADDVSAAKPDPEGFQRALDRAAVPAASALIFEDSEAGFEAARRAGIAAVDATRLPELMLAEIH